MKADPVIAAMIHTYENCINVHSGCHIEAGTNRGQLECIKFLIAFEGYSAIHTWLMQLSELLRGTQARQALLLLDTAMASMIGDTQQVIRF